MQYKAAGCDALASGPSSTSAPEPRDSPDTTQRETQRKLITVKGQSSSQLVGCRSVLIGSLTKKGEKTI